MPDDTRSVAPALRLFLWSRAAIWLLAVVAVVGFEGALNARRGEWDSARLHDLGAVVDVWARWDSDWFLRIAEDGYSWPSSTPAFFPLYPLLVAGLGPRPRRSRRPRRASSSRSRRAPAAFALLYRLTVRPARRGRRPADGPVPRARPDLALLRRRLQRVALPAPRRRDVPRRRARAVLAGRRARRPRAPDALGGSRAPAGARSSSPGGRPTGGARSRASPSRRCSSRSTRSLLAVWIGQPLAFLEAQKVVWERRLSPAGPLGGVVAAVAGAGAARSRRRASP